MLHDREPGNWKALLQERERLAVLLEQSVEKLSACRIRERFEHVGHNSINM